MEIKMENGKKNGMETEGFESEAIGTGQNGTLARRELVCRLGRSIISDSKGHLEL